MSPRTINRLSVLLLTAGLGAAVAIYLTTPPETVDPLLGNPLNSKKHLHELRLMGGHANVALAEFQAWFVSLWRGQQLATTIAVLTLLVVPAFRFVARHPDLFNPHGDDPSSPDPLR